MDYYVLSLTHRIQSYGVWYANKTEVFVDGKWQTINMAYIRIRHGFFLQRAIGTIVKLELQTNFTAPHIVRKRSTVWVPGVCLQQPVDRGPQCAGECQLFGRFGRLVLLLFDPFSENPWGNGSKSSENGNSTGFLQGGLAMVELTGRIIKHRRIAWMRGSS